MFKGLRNAIGAMLGEVTADEIRAQQVKDAERQMLEHEAAAEHHDALASMYRHRLERLRGHQEGRGAAIERHQHPAPVVPARRPFSAAA